MGDNNNHTIAELLRHHRNKHRLSQTDLAGLVGCSKSRISELENGRGLPTLELARQLDTHLETGTEFQETLRATKTAPYQLPVIVNKTDPTFKAEIDVLISTSTIETDSTPPAGEETDSFLHLTPTSVTHHLNHHAVSYSFNHGATITRHRHSRDFSSITEYSAWCADQMGRTSQHSTTEESQFPAQIFFCSIIPNSVWDESEVDTALGLLAAPSELHGHNHPIDLTSGDLTRRERLFLDQRHRVTGSVDLSCRPDAIAKGTFEGLAYHPAQQHTALNPTAVIEAAIQIQGLRTTAHTINTTSIRPADPEGFAVMLHQSLQRFATPMLNQSRHYQRLIDKLTQAVRLNEIVNAAINNLNAIQ